MSRCSSRRGSFQETTGELEVIQLKRNRIKPPSPTLTNVTIEKGHVLYHPYRTPRESDATDMSTSNKEDAEEVEATEIDQTGKVDLLHIFKF